MNTDIAEIHITFNGQRGGFNLVIQHSPHLPPHASPLTRAKLDRGIQTVSQHCASIHAVEAAIRDFRMAHGG